MLLWYFKSCKNNYNLNYVARNILQIVMYIILLIIIVDPCYVH